MAFISNKNQEETMKKKTISTKWRFVQLQSNGYILQILLIIFRWLFSFFFYLISLILYGIFDRFFRILLIILEF